MNLTSKVRAKRHQASSTTTNRSTPPNIDGNWEIQVKSPKGESVWHLMVIRSGGQASASILRVDGDTGTLACDYRDGKFVLSHFTGERPFLVELKQPEDSRLQVVISDYRKTQTLVAVRPDRACAKGVVPPDNPTAHTKLKTSSEPMRFSFPDINGHTRSYEDPRFGGRVDLVNITGTWCPNCHDEAPFLEAPYRKYHNQGLEIVALDFELAELSKDLSRLRAFIQRYGIEPTCLVALEPGQLHEKISQAENLNAWPTTFLSAVTVLSTVFIAVHDPGKRRVRCGSKGTTREGSGSAAFGQSENREPHPVGGAL